MANVDELVVQIKADTKGLRKGLGQVNSQLKKTSAETKKSVVNFKTLGTVFATLGLAKLIGGTVSTIRTFEDLNATLTAITGSTENAAIAMAGVGNFTKTTTFQLENVNSAFATLLNAGIAPTSEVLKDFGNLAAAFGKDITQIAQAVFNATTGETEMLKQFGIKAKLEGDKITMIFRGASTTIGRNSTEIVNFLRGIAQENFANALEARLGTISGAFSNLKDNAALIAVAIGEGGVRGLLVDLGKSAIDLAKRLEKPALIVGAIMTQAFLHLGVAIDFVRPIIDKLVIAMGFFIALKVGGIAAAMAVSFIQLSKAVFISAGAFLAASTAVLATPWGAIAFVIGGTAVAIAEMTGAMDGAKKKAAELLSMDSFLKPELLEKLNNSLNKVNMTVAETDAGIVAITEKMLAASKGLTPTVKDTTDAIHDMTNEIAESSSAFTTDFVTGLMEGKSALSSFGDFAKDIVKQIIATFIRLTVVNKILNSVFKGFGGFTELGTAGANDFGLGKITGFFRNEVGVAESRGLGLTGNANRAGGGTVQAGRPTLVGERGAEIFVPNSSGRIMNNADSQGGGGGGVVINQSINFSTGVVATVRAEVGRMMPQIADTTKAAVLEASQRGGSFRKGLMGAT